MARAGGAVPIYGPRWPQIAAAIRVRDGHRCRRCDRPWAAGEPAYPVDHLVPRRMFLRADGTLDPAADASANLVTLCPACHALKTARAEPRALRGDRHDLTGFLRALDAPPLGRSGDDP